MLNHDQLVELYREHRQEKILSVYLDGRANDFAERKLWRKRLEQEVAEAKRRLNGTMPDENGAFDGALRQVAGALESFDQFLPDRGWVGFATQERLLYGQAVRVPMPDLVRWESGIRVAPYVRALKQARPVVLALVDSRRARIFEYRDGILSEPVNLNAETFLGDLTDVNVSKRPTGHTGVRGKTATDAAQRFLNVGSERMLKEVLEHVNSRAGSEGRIVLGGAQEVVAHVIQHLATPLRDRTVERTSMNLEMSDADILGALEGAASELNQTIQVKLLSEVVDLARSGGRGALGPRDVEQALKEGRVDTLILSRTFIRGNPDYADHLVGAALEHHGEVEEVSFEGAQLLDVEGQGAAARLRYVVSG